jgi:hypothetical protein
MAFTTKELVIMGEQAKIPASTNDELSLGELEFLLNTLKNCDLKGHQVEMFYNLIVKIQNQYIKKTK